MSQTKFPIEPLQHYITGVVENIYGDRATETFKKKQIDRAINSFQVSLGFEPYDDAGRIRQLVADLIDICIDETIEDGQESSYAGDYISVGNREYSIEVRIDKVGQ